MLSVLTCNDAATLPMVNITASDLPECVPVDGDFVRSALCFQYVYRFSEFLTFICDKADRHKFSSQCRKIDSFAAFLDRGAERDLDRYRLRLGRPFGIERQVALAASGLE